MEGEECPGLRKENRVVMPEGVDELALARMMRKLDPNEIRLGLIEAAGFLALFELLRAEVILAPAGLFFDSPPTGTTGDLKFTRFKRGKLVPSKRYREVVLRGQTEKFDAYALAASWLASVNAITPSEVAELLAIRKYRNEVAHELQEILIDPDRRLRNVFSTRASELLAKVGRWGVRNIELEGESAQIPDEELETGRSIMAGIVLGGMRRGEDAS